MKRLSLILCLCVVIWVALIKNSHSQDTDIEDTSALKLKAESAILNKKTGILSFSGSVEVTFKEYKIKSDILKATQNKQIDKDKISILRAIGNVYITNNKDIVAYGDGLTFNVEKQFILIEGNVEFTQGKSVIKGKRVYIDLLTENVEFDGSINSYIVN